MMQQAPSSPVARAPPSTPRHSHISTSSTSSTSSRMEKSPFIAAGGLTALRAAASRMNISELKYDPVTADCHVDIFFTLKPGVDHPNFGEEDVFSFAPTAQPTAQPTAPAPVHVSAQSQKSEPGVPSASKLQPDDVWLARRNSSAVLPDASVTQQNSMASIASPKPGVSMSDNTQIGADSLTDDMTSPGTASSPAPKTPESATDTVTPTKKTPVAAPKSMPDSPITPYKNVTLGPTVGPEHRSPSKLHALRRKASLFGRERKKSMVRINEQQQENQTSPAQGVDAHEQRRMQKKESREARKKMAAAWAQVGGESSTSETFADASAAAGKPGASGRVDPTEELNDEEVEVPQPEYPGALFDERRQAMTSPTRSNSTKVVGKLSELTRRASRKISLRRDESRDVA